MAITILNTTHNDTIAVGNSASISIPATSVGSTLIVLVSTKSGAASFIGPSTIQDNEAIDYTQVSSASTSAKPSSSLAVDVWYRTGVPAGLTTVNVYYGYNSVRIYTTIIEASGVNVVSPVETGNTKTTTATTSNPVGNSTSTAFTNALFVGTAVTTLSTGMTTLNNSWTRTSTDTADHKQGYLIASGSTTMSINETGSSSQTYLVGTAVFNPTANVLTLNLSDSTTLDSGIVNEADLHLSKSESVALTDAFDAILSTLNHFKTLMDMLTMSDSFSAVISFVRSLGDSVTLIDSVDFIHNSQRVLSDSIRVQDWLEIERNSDQWGN